MWGHVGSNTGPAASWRRRTSPSVRHVPGAGRGRPGTGRSARPQTAGPGCREGPGRFSLSGTSSREVKIVRRRTVPSEAHVPIARPGCSRFPGFWPPRTEEVPPGDARRGAWRVQLVRRRLPGRLGYVFLRSRPWRVCAAPADPNTHACPRLPASPVVSFPAELPGGSTDTGSLTSETWRGCRRGSEVPGVTVLFGWGPPRPPSSIPGEWGGDDCCQGRWKDRAR